MLPPLKSEVIRFSFSREGQTRVVEEGYFPVNATIATEEPTAVGLR
jgi:hypothetical protein